MCPALVLHKQSALWLVWEEEWCDTQTFVAPAHHYSGSSLAVSVSGDADVSEGGQL